MSENLAKRKKKLKNKKRLKNKRKQRNRKRFRKLKTKHNPKLGPRVDCKLSSWSDWSSCSVTCGRGIVMKTRKILTKDYNGGKPCPRKMNRKKKCKLAKCRKYPMIY